ncbi:hypothetical protein FN846DRAFT_139882 [Sphaerosporella brunnea]|uniref:Uncharacterized protein n=1 Tax=Sphaerosporella brunnea TaxID=1250544 RepID=A0A5J5EQG8_9PEZI|nr:hypothetical protein FN846DRAFT_139882 [Sphaerosporella brunnea]
MDFMVALFPALCKADSWIMDSPPMDVFWPLFPHLDFVKDHTLTLITFTLYLWSAGWLHCKHRTGTGFDALEFSFHSC